MIATLIAATMFLFHQPGICDNPTAVVRHSFVLNGSVRILAMTFREGTCLPINSFWIEQFNNRTWQVRCEMAGAEPGPWATVPPIMLGLNEGECP